MPKKEQAEVIRVAKNAKPSKPSLWRTEGGSGALIISPDAQLSLLLIEWSDAGTVGNGSDWMTLDEVRQECADGKYINRSIGWLVYEDKSLIVLSSQVQLEPDESEQERRYDLVMRIPKSLIKSRKVIE